jgi:hypothetical protein
MNRYLQMTWIRNSLLLGAFAAGGMLTQVMPTYEEMAALRAPSPTPSAATQTQENSSADMARQHAGHAGQRHAKTVQRTS